MIFKIHTSKPKPRIQLMPIQRIQKMVSILPPIPKSQVPTKSYISDILIYNSKHRFPKSYTHVNTKLLRFHSPCCVTPYSVTPWYHGKFLCHAPVSEWTQRLDRAWPRHRNLCPAITTTIATPPAAHQQRCLFSHRLYRPVDSSIVSPSHSHSSCLLEYTPRVLQVFLLCGYARRVPN